MVSFFLPEGRGGRLTLRERGNPMGPSNSLLVDVLEDVLEPPVISLEDGVLGGHVEGPLLLQGLDEGGMGKVGDGLVRVVHAHDDTAALLECEQVILLRLASLAREHYLDLDETETQYVCKFEFI